MERITQWLSLKYARWAGNDTAGGWQEEINQRLRLLRPRKLRGVPLHDLRFVVFDTETTGFYPKEGDELLSIGAVILTQGQILEETFHRFINPHRPVPPVVTALTGITQEQADRGEEAAVVIRDFLDFAGTGVLVGHSVDFDLCFLNHTLKRMGCQSITLPALDTYWLARAVHPGCRDLSLDGLLALYRLEPAGRHTALGDALLTARLLVKLLEQIEPLPDWDYFDLCGFIQRRIWQHELTGQRLPRF
ncbi:MAG TPA: 3'-5' exonuclease [Clostridia bacterium]|nr:3'-5' exonuclease [Clostridia bacterium]